MNEERIKEATGQEPGYAIISLDKFQNHHS